MNKSLDVSGGGVLLDIDAELQYWEEVLPVSEFRDMSMSFASLVPTIKFGYDCYLLHHGKPLAEVLPQLRTRYAEKVHSRNQLDWRWADQIIRHTWGRMQAG